MFTQKKSLPFLIDNSTYFSFKSAIGGKDINASVLYNLTNFLECLIFTDQVILAPTVSWCPDVSDILFEKHKVCSQYPIKTDGNNGLQNVFIKALVSSTTDLNSHGLPIISRYSKKEIKAANALINNWKEEVQKSPKEFLKTYSGAVFETDNNSKDYVNSLNTGIEINDDRHRHLAQYLLRTNVALEITSIDPNNPIAYHPHSHRKKFVSSKLSKLNKEAMGLATSLLKTIESSAEQVITRRIDNSMLSSLGAFSHIDTQCPLILNIVLSGSNSASEIIENAMKIRNTREAKRYRNWISKLVIAVKSGKFSEQLEAENELINAKIQLNNELEKLYGLGENRLVHKTSSILGAVDIEKLATGNLLGAGISAGKYFIGKSATLSDYFHNKNILHKVAFLVTLQKQREMDSTLKDLITRTFGKQIVKDEIEIFYKSLNS